MAGSNGSSAHRGGQAPQGWPPETEEQARALEYARWQQQQAQQGYATDPAHQQAAGLVPPAQGQPFGYDNQQPQGSYDSHPGYIQPTHNPAVQYGQAPAPPGYAQPAQAPAARSSHAPQFERFTPGQAAPAHDPYGRYEPAAQTTGYPAPFAHDPHALGAPQDPRGGYAQPGYPGPHDADPRQMQARADVQSWDLSNYAPGQIPPGYGAQPGAPGHDPRGQPMGAHGAPAGHDAQWQQPGGGAHWAPQGGSGALGYDGAQQGHYQPRPGEPGYQPGGAPHDNGYDPDEAHAPEEKRRGPGTLLIVSALVGAIAVGGGLAYGYKMLGGGVRDKGKPPVVKAEANPARTVPKDAGGKTMENTDKKFLNRLASDTAPVPTSLASAEPVARGGDIEGATKKVQSIPITLNRDGTLTPQAGRPAEPVSGPSSGVPGLVIDGLGPPPGAPTGPPLRGASGSVPPAPAARAIPPPPPPPAVRSAPVAPKIADLPLPKVIQPQPPAAAEPKGPAKAATVRTPVPKKTARDDLLAAPGAALAATPAPAVADGVVRKGSVVSTGASGYVAVLASKKSRQDALNSFADLHQKYPDILTGMTPDVREADLKDKGLWYRLIVGPPGSQQAARSLCVKLNERGMKDCWPVAY